jgi:hypothetical protein
METLPPVEVSGISESKLLGNEAYQPLHNHNKLSGVWLTKETDI